MGMQIISRLPNLRPQRLQIRVFQGHHLHLLRITQLQSGFQPFPRLRLIAKLAGVTGKVVGNQRLLGKQRLRFAEDFPGLRYAAAGHPSGGVGMGNPELGFIGPNLDKLAGDFSRQGPFPGLGINLKSNQQHVRMGAKRQSDFLQFLMRLLPIAQPKPAQGGGKVKSIRRFQRIHRLIFANNVLGCNMRENKTPFNNPTSLEKVLMALYSYLVPFLGGRFALS
jgi:hypothetical protein